MEQDWSLGKEVCDDGKTSTHVTDVLNRPTTSRRICGLYPSEICLYQKRNITIQAVYEIMEIPRTDINNEAVYRTMEDIVWKQEKEKRNKGTGDNGDNETKESNLEVKNLFRSNLAYPVASKTKSRLGMDIFECLFA